MTPAHVCMKRWTHHFGVWAVGALMLVTVGMVFVEAGQPFLGTLFTGVTVTALLFRQMGEMVVDENINEAEMVE